MKLGEKEAEVLACAEHRANMTAAEIGKETGLQQQTVHRALSSLEERGVIVKRPFINIVPAGYSYFGVYFSRGAADEDSTTALLQGLTAAKEVVWVAEMGGDYQYGFAVCVKQVYEVQDFLNRLSERFPQLFFEKSVAGQFSATSFSRRYLSGKRYTNQPLSVQSAGEAVDLDDVDRKILGSLMRLKYNSRRDLARQLAMPLSTLDDRVHRLEQKKIIAGYVYSVDPSKIGRQAHTLLVYAKGMSRALSDAIFRYADEHPVVVDLYRCLGSWDFELNIEVTEGREVTTVVADLNRHFKNELNTVKALSKFRDLKLSWVPF